MLLLPCATALCVVGATYVGPQVLRIAQVRAIRRRAVKSRSLVLTYDDGPGATFTPQLLELLTSYGAVASFFLLGIQVRKNPQIVDRILAGGHEIGCHGDSHVHAWRTWPWRAVADIREGYRSLAPWVAGDVLFRPPHGKVTLLTWLAIRRRGTRLAWWTVNSGDTHPTLPKPQTVSDCVTRSGGGIVLMHDFDRSADRGRFVLQTTELLLQTARREGLAVRRLSDLWLPPKAG